MCSQAVQLFLDRNHGLSQLQDVLFVGRHLISEPIIRRLDGHLRVLGVLGWVMTRIWRGLRPGKDLLSQSVQLVDGPFKGTMGILSCCDLGHFGTQVADLLAHTASLKPWRKAKLLMQPARGLHCEKKMLIFESLNCYNLLFDQVRLF